MFFFMEPTEITNAHDRFFCESMQKMEIAYGVMNLYIDPQILQSVEINSLGILKDDWVDEKLKEHRADIVYQGLLKGSKEPICFLFEHKSYLDSNSSRQILRYMNQIWEQMENEDPGGNHVKKLPSIVPVIIYHGNKPWNIINSLKPLFAITSGVWEYIPDFKVVVVDLSVTKISSLLEPVELRAFLLALKYSRSEQVFDKVAEIIELFNSQLNQEYLKTVLLYIGAVIRAEKVDRFLSLISETHKNGESFMKTVADVLREQGIVKGIKQGIKQGIEHGRKMERERSQKIETDLRKEIQNEQNEIVKRMLQRNFSIETIHQITDVSVDKILEIKIEINK